MEFFDTLARRHSIRSFQKRPVERAVLDRLFDAASLAPSALNEQPWRFYVASGEKRREIIQVMAQSTHYLEEYMALLGHEPTEEALRWYSELGDAPVIVAATMPKVDDDFARLNKHLSVAGAIQNLLLAATDMGLGSCNITFSFWVRDELAPVFGVDPDRTIVALVVLGYPTDEPPHAPGRNHDIAVYVD